MPGRLARRPLLTRRHPAALAALLLGAAAPAPVTVGGAVDHPQSFDTAALAHLPQATETITITGMHGSESHVFRGPALWTLLSQAAPTLVQDTRKFGGHAIRIEGADGYATIVAAGEIDPALEGKDVIIALTADAKPLPAPRLVIPGEHHAARDVRDVVAVTLD